MQSKNPVMNWWHYCQGTFTNCNECNYKQWKILMIQKSVLILTEYSSRFSNCKSLFEFMPREMENRSIFMVTPQCIHLFKTVLHMLNYMWRTILRIHCRFLSPVLRGWQTVSEAEGKGKYLLGCSKEPEHSSQCLVSESTSTAQWADYQTQNRTCTLQLCQALVPTAHELWGTVSWTLQCSEKCYLLNRMVSHQLELPRVTKALHLTVTWIPEFHSPSKHPKIPKSPKQQRTKVLCAQHWLHLNCACNFSHFSASLPCQGSPRADLLSSRMARSLRM